MVQPGHGARAKGGLGAGKAKGLEPLGSRPFSIGEEYGDPVPLA
jgi:hypothetical protein